jgi:hypothetical protein
MTESSPAYIHWPDNKAFAFTIFDDTDCATIDNVGPVYDMLADLGFRTTKSVWPMQGTGKPMWGGQTCEDPEYVEWLYALRRRGFEIGYHLNTYHTSRREDIERGLKRFTRLFGHPPVTFANHADCEDSIYGGAYRVSGPARLVYNLATRFRNARRFTGHIEHSPYFWGDLCRAQTRYCRNFVFPDINTLRACPWMPYHDPLRPYVNYWYASSEGINVDTFCRCIGEKHQDRLEKQGGACIMYTHLAVGFFADGALDKRFQSLMERLSRKNGWFVPVATLLDYLLKVNGSHTITDRERSSLERRWLLYKLRVGHH